MAVQENSTTGTICRKIRTRFSNTSNGTNGRTDVVHLVLGGLHS